MPQVSSGSALADSGQRMHATVAHSQPEVLEGAPHGCNVSHDEIFNRMLLQFLEV